MKPISGFVVVLMAAGCWCASQSDRDNTHNSILDNEATFQQHDADTRNPNTEAMASALSPLYTMTNFFLESILQARYLTNLIDKGFDVSTPDALFESIKNDWGGLLVYLIGFTVCVAIGVVLFIVMLISCLVVPCCRCCGNCGGKVTPKETKNTGCTRGCCGFFLLLFTGIMAVGAACIFGVNESLKKDLRGSTSIFDSAANAIPAAQMYLDHTLSEMEQLALVEFGEVKDAVFRDLDNIPTAAVETINNRTLVLDNFANLYDFIVTLPELSRNLTHTSDVTEVLSTTIATLGTELEIVTNALNQSIANCTEDSCKEMADVLLALKVQGNFTAIALTLRVASTAVNITIDQGIVTTVEEVNHVLSNITNTIKDKTSDPVEEAKQIAIDLEKEIKEELDELNGTIQDIDFDGFTDSIHEAKDDSETVVTIAYWCIFGLGIIVSLICFFNLVGLLHDMLCRRRSPKRGCCDSDKTMGAHWLLAGVGFSFFFYFIFTLVVVVLFAVGGLVHTEACRHLVHHQDSSSHQVLMVFDNWIDIDDDISVIESYDNCGENQAFYTALNLDSMYNISELLDLTEVKKAVDDVKAINISIGTIDVFPENLNESLHILDGIFALNFNYFYAELDQDVTTPNLTFLINALKELENVTGVDDNALVDNISVLTSIHYNYTSLISDQKDLVRAGLTDMDAALSGVNLSVITSSLVSSGEELNERGDDLIKTFVTDTADEVYNTIENFTEQVEDGVRNDVGKCGPVYGTVSELINQACVHMLWSVNGLWFSLGWCIFFLIPTIIISLKLVTIYRKTYPYSYDEPEATDDQHQRSDYSTPPPQNQVRGNPKASSDMMQMQPMYSNNKGLPLYAADNPGFAHAQMPRAVLPVSKHSHGGAPPPMYNNNWQGNPENFM